MKFQVEDLGNIKTDLEVLLVEHHKETGVLDSNRFPLDPAWHLYEMINDSDALHIVTARDQGDLVGYCVFFISQHPHYQQNLIAENDLVFLSKDYRKGLTGYKLIGFAVKSLKQRGIHLVSLRTKNKNSFGRLAERLGFKAADTVYIKEL